VDCVGEILIFFASARVFCILLSIEMVGLLKFAAGYASVMSSVVETAGSVE